MGDENKRLEFFWHVDNYILVDLYCFALIIIAEINHHWGQALALFAPFDFPLAVARLIRIIGYAWGQVLPFAFLNILLTRE